MRIEHLYWDTITIEADLDSEIVRPNVYVFWPSPVEFDPCFEQAGLATFTPVDVAWKKSWRTTVQAAIKHLRHFGTPMLRNPVLKTTLWGQIKKLTRPLTHYRYQEPTLADLVNLCSRQDGHPAAIVDFGDQHGLTLMAADGHPILWVLVDARIQFSPQQMALAITPGVNVEQRSLDWAKLLPGKANHGDVLRG